MTYLKSLPRAHINHFNFGLILGLLCIANFTAEAVPGDRLVRVQLPVPGQGVSVGVDCEGFIYYTRANDQNLYKIDKHGTLQATIPVTDSITGLPLTMDEMAWDAGRQLFWIQQHDSNPIRVYTLDRTTGKATFAFTSATISAGTFRDGMTYDPSDDTLWISGDLSTTIEQYTSSGVFFNQITPKDSSGGVLGSISGVQIGLGDLLYLGRPRAQEIVKVKKSNGDWISGWSTPGFYPEGLECDPVNFPSKVALWARDEISSVIFAYEIEPGSCACAKICPDDIEVCNDPGECGAVVTYPGPACNPPSGSFFPVGTHTVICSATCSFKVIVKDCEAPTGKCVPATNPSGKNVPTAGNNPRSGENPDGFYQLVASDNCIGPLEIFIKDSAEGPCGGTFTAGPYAPGSLAKLTQSPGQAGAEPMAGVVVAHINTRGEPVMVIVDSAGNSTCHKCFIPPPPK